MMSAIDTEDLVVIVLDCMEGTAQTVLADADKRKSFAGSVNALIAIADAAGVPVVRVEVSFREGHPEVAASNAFFSGAKSAGRLVENSDQTALMAEFAETLSGRLRVSKRRIGAFAGGDLAWVLRGLGRSHIVLAGLVTRGAVLSTACDAADNDYRVTVISDACHDPDPEVHRVLTTAVLPLRAAVISTGDLGQALGS